MRKNMKVADKQKVKLSNICFDGKDLQIRKNNMIVFLDIDGVIATSKSYNDYPDLLDPRCIKALNYLTHTLKAKIVISSTWRTEGLVHLKDLLKSAGVKAEVIGLTKHIYSPFHDEGSPRGLEILQWIKDNEYKGEYVVVDDEISDISPHINEANILHTGRNAFSKGGLKIKDVEKYINRRRMHIITLKLLI